MRVKLLGLVVGLLALLVVVPVRAQEAAVNVELKEWNVIPDATSVPAGDIEFAATNTGSVAHDLVVVRTELAPEALPVVGAAVDEQAVEVAGSIPLLSPGETGAGTFSLAPGSYVLICNVPGHYQSGMYTGFSVTEAPAATPAATAAPEGEPTAAPSPAGAPVEEFPVTGSGGSASSTAFAAGAWVLVLSAFGVTALSAGACVAVRAQRDD